MKSADFKKIRAAFGKTQKEMAQILGTSLKAIHSYEQGWRTIPHHVERQLLFILSRFRNLDGSARTCWDIMDCPEHLREKCPAWEFNCGDICWFINGTICSGKPLNDWKTKIALCKTCRVFHRFFPEDGDHTLPERR
ncbi:MAG: helix-turn-helix transcriptional regulator [Desulfamplus sp.]|nr:helix-turn-helix transcriptional regulator [Desulfamplus sp.]